MPQGTTPPERQKFEDVLRRGAEHETRLAGEVIGALWAMK